MSTVVISIDESQCKLNYIAEKICKRAVIIAGVYGSKWRLGMRRPVGTTPIDGFISAQETGTSLVYKILKNFNFTR